MNEIIIPERLINRLDTDWGSRVTALQSKVQTLVKDSPYFFPDYTDHGVDHINEVLNLADRLIPDETYEAMVSGKEYLLDPRSMGFLLCAILLHDIGMFLYSDGMEYLIQGARGKKKIDGLDDDDWKTEWLKYVEKVRRMRPGEQVHQFGREVSVSPDCVKKGLSTTEEDKRIIGEFLRRNHGRLARDIAIHGFPGSKNQDLFEGAGLSANDRKMIGILARSHCMDIRNTEGYLKKLGAGSWPHGIPAFYLMAVLRMADYLDASEKRAPELLERVRKIHVPASEKEWCWNQRITKGPKHWNVDKHNLEISAEPTKTTEYVLLDEWVRSVQAELDQCWAVLADQYTGEPFRLPIHRICANIHQEEVRKGLEEDFLTKPVRVSASPKIVELMMEPLYGDEPTYGVRELLQNAVDACVERKKYEEDHDNPNYRGFVDIRVEGDTFTITDNGMGMNEDILLNYYLCAGSSYRDSESWRAANAPDGESRVARTGKFGVGFLASFLLGDEIRVHTQYPGDEKGYLFQFDKRSMPLDVKREERVNPWATEEDDPVGTTITIKLKDTAIRGFNSNYSNYSNYPWYDWYAFDEPKVRYSINGTQLHHHGLQLYRDPQKNEEWFTLSAENFDLYQWNPNFESKDAEFYCNGIRIYTNAINLSKDELNLPIPHVSVIDKNGHLDVKLSRNSLRTFPMMQELYRELYCWHIARLLLTPWDNEDQYQKNCISGFAFSCGRNSKRTPFLLSRRGFNLNHASVMPLFNLKDYVILCLDGTDIARKIQNVFDSFRWDVPISVIVDVRIPGEKLSASFDWKNPVGFFEQLLARTRLFANDSAIQYSLKNCCDSYWLSETLEYLIPCIPADSLKQFPEMYDIHLTNPPSEMPIDRSKFQASDFLAAIHLVNRFNFYRMGCSHFSRTLREVLVPEPDYPDQDLWIPYDMEERKKKFKSAFKKLEPYMKHIRNHPFE